MTNLALPPLHARTDDETLAHEITLLAGQINAANQQLVFATPSGKSIEVSHFPQFPGVSAETFHEALGVMAPSVDPKTCVTHWHGEDCDYGLAIDALLRRDGGGGCARDCPA